MRKKHWIICCAVALSGCAQETTVAVPQKHYDTLATGTVASIGPKEFVLQEKDNVIFIHVDGTDPALLQRLKKGEQVTVLGQNKTETKSKGKTSTSAEIDEIVLEDGTHIPIGQ